jgi:hypothetical protein
MDVDAACRRAGPSRRGDVRTLFPAECSQSEIVSLANRKQKTAAHLGSRESEALYLQREPGAVGDVRSHDLCVTMKAHSVPRHIGVKDEVVLRRATD